MITRDRLRAALEIGQPGCLIRLAEWLGIDVVPSDEAAFEALVNYYETGYWLGA